MKYSFDTPGAHEIAMYSDLRRHSSQSYFIVENEKVVSSLLASDIEIVSLYCTKEHFEAKREEVEKHKQTKPAKVFLAKKEDMSKIVGFGLHQGILASANTPKGKTLTEIMKKAAKPSLFVMLDEVTDAENMGALYRTALALHATAVIIDKKSTSPWMRRSVRVSMGAVFSLPTIKVQSLPQAIEELRSSGIKTFAATTSPAANTLYGSDLTGDVALMFGSEGHGIKPEVIAACDGEINLPMPNLVDSLNVAVAQGIFLYEVRRQRALMMNNR